MEEKELKTKSLDELKQRATTIKTATWTLVGMLLVLFCVALYLTLSKGSMQVLLAVPIALLPIVVLNFKNLKKIHAEIRERGTLQQEGQ